MFIDSVQKFEEIRANGNAGRTDTSLAGLFLKKSTAAVCFCSQFWDDPVHGYILTAVY
jgi:hypothetical protein